MTDPAPTQATYADLHTIPENMVGEIIDGELHAVPRPSPHHAKVTSELGAVVMHPYRFGRGGPGGWRFLDKSEIRLGENILVSDIAGWKKERFPAQLETNWIDIPPDWICEVLSPRTLLIDKTRKMPIYARHSVGHIWLINPMDQTLEVFKLASGGWLLLNTFAENDNARAEPLPEAEIDLGEFWWETPSSD